MQLFIRLAQLLIGPKSTGEPVIVDPSYTPALQFNEAQNSMYLTVIGV